MKTRVLVAAAAFVVAGTISGCDRTVPGTVAMTTEPGESISTPRTTSPRTSTPRTSTPRTSTPRTSTPRTSSNNPPPAANIAAITCKEYLTLDPDTQTSVVEQILSDQASVFGPSDAELAKTLVDAACTFLPTSRVSEILSGDGPP